MVGRSSEVVLGSNRAGWVIWCHFGDRAKPIGKRSWLEEFGVGSWGGWWGLTGSRADPDGFAIRDHTRS